MMAGVDLRTVQELMAQLPPVLQRHPIRWRRLCSKLCTILELPRFARVAKLADARDLKHDSALLLGIANFCKTLQKEHVARGGLRANTSPSRQVLATFSATVLFVVERSPR